ncbi:MAG: SDR family NAD(P)-dependent oxidoreductase [Parasphingopyxis sp.]|uniref:SDR family NAD(P)-dependent oxidoreductase n=1 Tax=Parasphingopyxis sp. TaxID=1920299 RepID=UPI003FA18FE0
MHIVMTGATSGLGEEAARRLLARDDVTLTIGSRSGSGDLPESGRLTALPLDMARLADVATFCERIGEGEPIDVLVLNAGLQLSKPATSPDGIELTFAVNHLAHFLMIERLRERLADGARVVLTASGTHDPEEKTPVTPPDHANVDWLTYPERDPRLPKGTRQRVMRAYSTSKLCNVLTARELARRHPGIATLAFDPGYVPGTGLSRDYPRWLMAIVSRIIVRSMAKDRTSTVPVSGGYLAELAVDPRFARAAGEYWSVRGTDLLQVEPSALARDAEAARTLWDDSAALLAALRT